MRFHFAVAAFICILYKLTKLGSPYHAGEVGLSSFAVATASLSGFSTSDWSTEFDFDLFRCFCDKRLPEVHRKAPLACGLVNEKKKTQQSRRQQQKQLTVRVL